MAPRTQRTRKVETQTETADVVQDAVATTAPDFSSKAPRNSEVASMPSATAPRISFDRGSQDGDVRERSRTAGAFEARGHTDQVSDIRERISAPQRPGDLPIAVIDGYGFVLPFSADNPIDRVILSQIPGVTFIYTVKDYQMVKAHNDEMIRKQRFEDTLQGAKLRLPPTSERHGFRNGREVVASFVDETMLNNSTVEQQFNQYSM